jgi:general stress protein 26
MMTVRSVLFCAALMLCFCGLNSVQGGEGMGKYEEAMKVLDEKFGNKDQLLSLSTISLAPGADGKSRPAARLVNAYYEDGSFYITTYATSGKMLQIAENPEVAICVIVDSFTADGIGENLGWVRDEKNAAIMEKVRKIFAEWYYAANNEEDPNTCLLRVRLTEGLWNFPHEGTRSEIDFVEKTVE